MIRKQAQEDVEPVDKLHDIWNNLPMCVINNPKILKEAIKLELPAVFNKIPRNSKDYKEAWTEENEKLFQEKLSQKRELYNKFLSEYNVDTYKDYYRKLYFDDPKIFMFFGKENLNSRGTKYLFDEGYANILNDLIDKKEVSSACFNPNQLKALDNCREFDAEDSLQREFSKFYCKYVSEKEDISEEEIDEIFKKVKFASEACKHLNLEFRKDKNILNVYTEYLKSNIQEIDTDKISLSFDVIKRIEYSNSSELAAFTGQIANDVLKTDEPVRNLEEIEEVFLKNRLPMVGKIWEVFHKLHPDLKEFNFSGNSAMSPVLKNSKSITERKSIIFADLIRATIGSNNKSFNEYIDFIGEGSRVVEDVIQKNQLPEKGSKDSETLMQFVENMVVLYKCSLKSKLQPLGIDKDDTIIEKITKLRALFNPTEKDMPLEDCIVRMFCHYAGFDSIEEIKDYQKKLLDEREKKHKETAQRSLSLNKGDYIKGIGDIKYLSNILENGSLAKEFLGDSSTSDCTPLDTDCSLIMEQSGTLKEKMDQTIAKSWGPIWIVLKGDDRFNISRDSDNYNDKERKIENPKDKLEVFSASSAQNGHCGIRTGFASSEIDAFIAGEHFDRIALELAIKGMYIPVYDKDGVLKFSYKQYEELRSKMQGLSHFGIAEYEFSKDLDFDGIKEIENTLDKNYEEVGEKKAILYEAFKETFPEYVVDDKMGQDLTPGRIEILDTGSTGRGTNVIGDGDFDFIVRVDKDVLLDTERYDGLKKRFAKALGKDSVSDKFRFEGIEMDGLEAPIDVDMTFIGRTNKLDYSTEMCVKDRLETIKSIDPEKHKKVVANIIFAKQFMKENECYKPWHAGKNPQGGLGGVGIENWILQNGGSFKQACDSFLQKARGKKLEEFKKEYFIWDFGSNHMGNGYPHDNFVYNMNDSRI